MSLMRSFHVSSSGLVAQSQRLNIVASNIANAESVQGPDGKPYRAKHAVFRPTPMFGSVAAGVEVAAVVDSKAPMRSEYKPGHPNADAAGFVQMPNVNPVDEMVNMISASRSYQMNVEIMNTSRQLMQKTLDLGR
jgi:flagellar basal-body rod protein FlgC